MSRKSPIEHGVSGYTRGDGTVISSHRRGHGQRLRRPSRTVGKVFDEDSRMSELGFTVNFKYSDKPNDGESVIVVADTYQRALEEAFEERVDSREPIEVDMIDPDLDSILKFIGEGAKKTKEAIRRGITAAKPHVAKAKEYALKQVKKGAKLGAKYAIKGGHKAFQASVAVGKGIVKGTKIALTESSKLALYELERMKVRHMIRQCYSSDPIERRVSRIALKRIYPDIYDICHFSKDAPLTKRKKRRKKLKPKVVPRRIPYYPPYPPIYATRRGPP